jgi:hypothetical protein
VTERQASRGHESRDPLLYAAGVAIAPIAACGLAAALSPGRTVGSVVIASMIAVLAYLGGVVGALRLGDRQLAARVCIPVLLGGVVAAFSGAFSAAAALVAISISALWAYRVGLVGARDLLGLTGRDRYQTALVCTLLAGGPAVTRAVLYVL